MSLNPGTRIGSYEIAAQIGVGGMGEVYRATDLKLGRDLAIKVLPSAFTNDPERIGIEETRRERGREVGMRSSRPNTSASRWLTHRE